MKIDPYPPHSKEADIRCYSDQASRHITSNSQANSPLGFHYFLSILLHKLKKNSRERWCLWAVTSQMDRSALSGAKWGKLNLPDIWRRRFICWLFIYLFRILGCGWLMHFCSHAEHQLTTLVGSSGCQRIISVWKRKNPTLEKTIPYTCKSTMFASLWHILGAFVRGDLSCNRKQRRTLVCLLVSCCFF